MLVTAEVKKSQDFSEASIVLPAKAPKGQTFLSSGKSFRAGFGVKCEPVGVREVAGSYKIATLPQKPCVIFRAERPI